MPGFYPEGEYDLAGFIVGAVERERIINGKTVEVGDVILGLPSNGLHTNGYSLARKLLFEVAGYTPETYVNELKGKVGNELMRTHKSYWPVIKKLPTLPFSSLDRKSTRLNSSHGYISYAVFCLKKKKKKTAQSDEQPY